MNYRLAWCVVGAACALGGCAAATDDGADTSDPFGTVGDSAGSETPMAVPPSSGGIGDVTPMDENGSDPTSPQTPGAATPGSGTPGEDPTSTPPTSDLSPPEALPFAVDAYFFPSGYMGDGELSGIDDQEVCSSERPDDAMGFCHRFTWTPAGMGWGGVYWQHPDLNWGAAAGLPVPEGASSVAFTAWGEEGGEVVSFMAGMADPDGFESKLEDLVLTDTPTEYTIDLTGVTYSDVIGGFGWVAEGAEEPLVFFVDDIRWQ